MINQYQRQSPAPFPQPRRRLYTDLQTLAQASWSKAWSFYYGLSIPKRILLIFCGLFLASAGIVFIVFREHVLAFLIEFAQALKELKAGPFLFFFLISLISFPPLIGYSALSLLCGMTYGFPGGWPLLTAATLFGSTCSFLTFRYLLSGVAAKLAQSNQKFAALTRTLERDNIILLSMIRLCPLPYSLSNGAFASIPSVSLKSFFLSTLLTSPKLLIHVFVGDRLVKLGQEKDTATKIVDIFSILLAGVFSVVTAYTIYLRTIEKTENVHIGDYEQVEMDRDSQGVLELDSDQDDFSIE